MPSRKPFGFAFFLPFFIFLFPTPFLYFLIIKLRSLCPPLLLYPPVLNTLTSVITLFMHIFLMGLFPLLGYLQRICLQIFLPNPSLHLFFLVTVLFLD